VAPKSRARCGSAVTLRRGPVLRPPTRPDSEARTYDAEQSLSQDDRVERRLTRESRLATPLRPLGRPNLDDRTAAAPSRLAIGESLLADAPDSFRVPPLISRVMIVFDFTDVIASAPAVFLRMHKRPPSRLRAA